MSDLDGSSQSQPSPLLLDSIFKRAQHYPDIVADLTWDQLNMFFSMVYKLWPVITSESSSSGKFPNQLPEAVRDFLSDALGLDAHYIWDALSDIIAEHQLSMLNDNELFLLHGHKFQIGKKSTLYCRL